MGVRVSGLAELLQRLGQVSDATTTRAEHAAARVIAATARPPHRTGALAASVRAHGPAIVSALPYAGVIHNGWPGHHIRPQPFVTDAAQHHQDQWTSAFLTVFDDALG